jgi:1-acyl-sn-glycerol-3-phosphate acyltransferase
VLYAILKPCAAGLARVLFRLRATGIEQVPREGRLLLAANHASLLDPVLIGAALPRELDFLAKAELFRIPLFGGLVRRLNAHPVDRAGSDSAALRLALRLLADGRAVLVFPEGTRGTEGRLGPGRAGAGMLAALSGAPVVPVYIRGSGRALPRGAALPRPARVTVTVGAPLRFARQRGRARYQEISDEIMAAIGRLRTAAAGGSSEAPGGTRPDPTTPGRALAGRIH